VEEFQNVQSVPFFDFINTIGTERKSQCAHDYVRHWGEAEVISDVSYAAL